MRKLVAIMFFGLLLSLGVTAYSQPTNPGGGIDANIVNTPDVNVVNTPSVNVSNIPNVNVTNLPSVDINNQPIAITDVDRQAFQPVFEGFTFNFLNDQPTFSHFIDVPDGKIFVVEMVSARIFLNDQEYPNFVMQAAAYDLEGNPTSFPGPFSHTFGVTDSEELPGVGDRYIYTHPVKIYARDGLLFSISRTNPGNATGFSQVAISGHLIDE